MDLGSPSRTRPQRANPTCRTRPLPPITLQPQQGPGALPPITLQPGVTNQPGGLPPITLVPLGGPQGTGQNAGQPRHIDQDQFPVRSVPRSPGRLDLEECRAESRPVACRQDSGLTRTGNWYRTVTRLPGHSSGPAAFPGPDRQAFPGQPTALPQTWCQAPRIHGPAARRSEPAATASHHPLISSQINRAQVQQAARKARPTPR